MRVHSKPTHTAVDQVIGDVRAALKSLGPHGRLVLTVEAFDGALVHRVERSRLTEEDWVRLMEEPPRRVREVGR